MVALILFGVNLAPGLSAPFDTISNDVGSPTIGADYQVLIKFEQKR
jgi:hypothetical protein